MKYDSRRLSGENLSGRFSKDRSSKSRGIAAEAFAVSHFQQLGWKLWARNKKLASVEVDALFESPSGQLFIVECKTFSGKTESWNRLTVRQMGRLARAAEALQTMSARSGVGILIALVNLELGFIEVYDSSGELFSLSRGHS